MIDWQGPPGERVATERKRAGLTQTELAEAIGIARDKLSKIEHGTRAASASEVLAIAAALGVLPDDLVPRDTPMRFRGPPRTEAAAQSRELLEAYMRNWAMLDGLRTLDEG